MAVKEAVASVLIESECLLGESPIYRKGILSFCDLLSGNVYRASVDELVASGTSLRFEEIGPSAESKCQRKTLVSEEEGKPVLLGCIGARTKSDHGLVVCSNHGVHVVDDIWAGNETVVTLPAPSFNPLGDENAGGSRDLVRLNDGRCSPCGRFLFGAYNAQHRDDMKEVGGVWSLSSGSNGLELERIDCLGKVRVSNASCWSPQGDLLYFCDSPTGLLKELPWSCSDKSLPQTSRTLYDAKSDPQYGGAMDGACTDDQGGIWVARMNGGIVVRHNPSSGSIDCVIRLPDKVAQAASCTAGNNTLFITTARRKMSPEQLKECPLAGSVFSCDLTLFGLTASRDEPAFSG